MFAANLLAQSDPELWNTIRLENARQEDHVELIASENYVSQAVMIAQGSQLTNKYAEARPSPEKRQCRVSQRLQAQAPRRRPAPQVQPGAQ